MKKYTFKKGSHRALFSLPSFTCQQEIHKKVIFSSNCKYDLGTDDQYDHNKLFGIGYLFHHHTDSARFGWWYNIELDKMILSAYCYLKGERFIKDLCSVELETPYVCLLDLTEGKYGFRVYAMDGTLLSSLEIPKPHNKRLGYRLRPWFGGTSTAPHDMDLFLQDMVIL